MNPKPRAVLWVHVQPRAKKTETAGWHGDAVKIRIHSPPLNGAANDELVEFMAKKTGVPRSGVSIASGRGGRRKRVIIEGRTTQEVIAALDI
ncbi:MAG: DUF167 domain-containing protein [Gemmatimonadales bacterium]